MPDRNGVQLRVVTNAYSGNFDSQLAEQLKQINARDRISGLALVVKKGMPAVESAAVDADIPIFRFSTPEGFCHDYMDHTIANRTVGRQGYILCIASSLTVSEKILEGVGDTRTQLNTNYWKK